VLKQAEINTAFLAAPVVYSNYEILVNGNIINMGNTGEWFASWKGFIK
jgi:hypothetical protein